MTVLDKKSGPTVGQIKNFQNLVAEAPQIEFPVYHNFSDGVYLREFHMKAGQVVVGKKHKTRHLNVLVRGRCHVWTPEGQYTLDATDDVNTFESSPGVKKVVYALTDVTWITVHVTDERDMGRLEGQIIDPEEQLDLFPELDALPNSEQNHLEDS